MTSHREPHAIDIDDVINQVAREMTAAEPMADIRARVLIRLDERPACGIWRWMPLVTFAASVVIVVGAWALWPRTARPNETPPIAIARTEPAIAPLDTRALAASGAADGVVRVQRVSGTRRTAPEAMSDAELAWNERAVPALPGPAALTIDPLDHPGVTIAPIEIHPLVTEPLAIKAIGAGSEILK
jgi:hypothetical protein